MFNKLVRLGAVAHILLLSFFQQGCSQSLDRESPRKDVRQLAHILETAH